MIKAEREQGSGKERKWLEAKIFEPLSICADRKKEKALRERNMSEVVYVADDTALRVSLPIYLTRPPTQSRRRALCLIF